jgi:arylsulfatase A-like enzyme
MKILIKNKKFLFIIVLFLFMACTPKQAEQENAKPPNILYIMSDDHAYQAISAFGYDLIRTPNIDRLSKEGILFENSFVTNSICAPSRAVLLTGKHSHLNGVLDNLLPFDGSQQTFPKLLQKAGYETAMIGKWHLKTTPTGFDYFEILRGQGEYYNPFFIGEKDTTQIEGYVTDITTDLAIEWLKSRENKKPFCLLLHHKAPHRNWMPNLKHLSLYDGEDLPVPDTYFDDYNTRSAAAREQEMEIARDMRDAWDLKVKPEDPDVDKWEDKGYAWHYGKLMTDEQRTTWDAHYDPLNEEYKDGDMTEEEKAIWKYQRYIKDYLRCIASVDENVGRVLDVLDELNLSENTLIVYTSDQGFYLGEHGWFDKRFMYKESFRMPLLMRYPDLTEGGKTVTQLVQNLDFAPTFLELAGVAIPEDMQGLSLVPLMKEENPEDLRNSIYYHYYEYPGAHMVKRHYGIRNDRFKLIHFYHDIDAWELYDLKNDPNEVNNLIDNPGYEDMIQSLKEELKQLQVQYKDSISY